MFGKLLCLFILFILLVIHTIKEQKAFMELMKSIAKELDNLRSDVNRLYDIVGLSNEDINEKKRGNN